MKLVLTRDGIFESTESVPTAEQRAIGEKALSNKLKIGGLAARFLKVEPTMDEPGPGPDTKSQQASR